MRHLITALFTVALLVPLPVHAADAPRVEFPITAAGHHAEAWFAAYRTGEEALRAFWTAHGSPAALAERPVEPRLAFMRQVRADQGELTPVRVAESREDFCRVLARTEHGETVSIGFVCEATAPYQLISLRLERGGDAPDAGHVGPGGPHAGAAPAPEPDAPQGPPPTDAQIVGALTSQLDSLARAGAFSGALVLDKDGSTLFEHAAGMSSRLPRRPNTMNTRFNLGSLNKIFTHVAIEQLAEAGKLTLDDPVTRWLKDYKVANAGRITLRMLLDHKAGVPDVFANPGYERAAGRLRTMADWYALVREMPLEFEPGARQQYSNGGFVLLGMVVAAASHEDYYAYVRRHVYEPAGMTRTGHVPLDSLGDDVARGWVRDTAVPEAHDGDGTPPGLVANTASLPGRGSSAGGGYSTVGDLVRFARALRAGKLLDAAHVRDVFGDAFSLGIAGGSPGVNGLFVVAGPYTLAVLANLDPPTAEQFAPTIARMMRRAAGIPAPARR